MTVTFLRADLAGGCERASHDRACALVRTAVAISFGFPALISRMGRAPFWETAVIALAAFWIVSGLYLATVFALREVRLLRPRVRAPGPRGPGTRRRTLLADADLVALLLAAVLPVAIVMFSCDVVHRCA